MRVLKLIKYVNMESFRFNYKISHCILRKYCSRSFIVILTDFVNLSVLKSVHIQVVSVKLVPLFDK